MIIRKAKIKDLDQIVKLAVEFEKYHEKLDPYFTYAKDSDETYKKNVKRGIYSSKRLLLVAEENKKIVGYSLGKISTRSPIFKIREIGVIIDMFFSEGYRRKGLAKLFLKEMFDWFKGKKIKHVELYVVSNNEIGKNAWKKYGFEDILLRKKIQI